MATWSGLFAGTILAALALLHVYWVFRKSTGSAAVIPHRDGKAVFSPGPIATLAVAAALTVASILVLGASGTITLPLPASLVRAGAGLVALAFLLRVVGDFRYVGLFKRVGGTAFARMDTRLYMPLCLLIALASAAAAL